MNKFLKIGFCLGLYLLGTANFYAQSAEAILQKAQDYSLQNNYVLAQETYLEALKQAEKENKITDVIKAQQGVAMCHYYMRDKPSAIKWLHTALRSIKKSKSDEFIDDVYYKMSVMYIERGVADSAEYYSFKAIGLYEKEKNYEKLSQSYSALSDLYLNGNKAKKAEAVIKKAEHYADITRKPHNLAFVNMKWYFFHTTLKKDYKRALPYINKAEKYYTESGSREGIMYAYNQKAICLAMLGDTLSASYMEKWFAWKDSIFNTEKAADMAKFEKLYETGRKENENKLLHKENEQNKLTLLIVVIAFLLFIAVALWLLNRNRLRKKQEEIRMLQNLQADKERIARDLHDNVGGQLSYIIYSLDGINDEDDEKRNEITDSINQSVKSVIGSLRETIWAISDANIGIQDFSDKLKVFARNLFKHSDTKVNFTENIKTQRELNALLGLNLYRICQEILNNAFKYASATEVKIEVQCQEEKMLIMISDNGIGFNSIPFPSDKEEGEDEQYGLQNIKKRADDFGISLRLETEINKGTRYVLLV